MSKKENHIGKVLHFAESNYLFSLRAVKQYLLPPALTLANQYNYQFGEGAFTQAVFDEMLVYRLRNIEKAFIAAEEEKIKDLPEAVKELTRPTIAAKLNGIRESLERLFAAKLEAGEKACSVTHTATVELSLIKVVDGVPTIDEAQFRKQFEITIQTEEQNELYLLTLELQATHKKLQAFMAKSKFVYGWNWYIVGHDNTQGLTREDNNMNLHINPQAFLQLI